MDKDMMLEATDIVRSVADHQRGYKRVLARLINKICWMYYKIL